MGRKRIYQHHKIPNTVVMMVQTMIQDYPRRKRMLEYSSASSDVVNDECIKLNSIIEDAMNANEPMLNALIIGDIINERGYYQSEATSISSKNLYYRLKRKLIEDIAVRCNLI